MSTNRRENRSRAGAPDGAGRSENTRLASMRPKTPAPCHKCLLHHINVITTSPTIPGSENQGPVIPKASERIADVR